MIYQIVPGKKPHMTPWMKKYGPDILTYSGIGMMAGGTVVSCMAVKQICENPDIYNTKFKKAKKMAPGIAMEVTGGIMIGTGSHWRNNQLKEATSALGLAIGAMLKYRQRVAKAVGEEKEQEIFNNVEEVVIEKTDENGKVKKEKVKISNVDHDIAVGFYFDNHASYLADDNNDMSYNEQVLIACQAQLNDKLRGNPKHMMLLNEVYEWHSLFMENDQGQNVEFQTVAGQKLGWIYDRDNPTGDNTIILKRTRTKRRLRTGEIIETWYVEPNIDGDILDAAKERGLMK